MNHLDNHCCWHCLTVSRATALAQASTVAVVRKPRFSWSDQQANQLQILGKGNYPPYLQIFVFKILNF